VQYKAERAQRTRTQRQAKDAWTHFCTTWENEASPRAFDAKLREAQGLNQKYAALEQAYAVAAQKAAAPHQAAQLQTYVHSHTIEQAHVPGVGPQKVASLRAAGVITAADVTNVSLTGVTGIGPKIAADLLAWRQHVEAGFVFDASSTLTPADHAKLARVYQPQFQDLQAKLTALPAALTDIQVRTIGRRAQLRPTGEALALALAQAEADLTLLHAVRPATFVERILKPGTSPAVAASSAPGSQRSGTWARLGIALASLVVVLLLGRALTLGGVTNKQPPASPTSISNAPRAVAKAQAANPSPPTAAGEATPGETPATETPPPTVALDTPVATDAPLLPPAVVALDTETPTATSLPTDTSVTSTTPLPPPAVVVPATETPTVTPSPTNTPLPSETTTAIPPPTNTPLPTDTPTATATPLPPPTAASTPGVVAVDVANLRGGPGANFSLVGSASAGQVVAIMGRDASGTWLQLAGGEWISAELVSVAGAAREPTPTLPAAPTATIVVSIAPAQGQAWAVVNADGVNVRAEPSTAAAIVGGLTGNQCVEVLALQPEWVQVQLVGAGSGWCWRDYLTTMPACPTPAPEPTATPAPEPTATPVPVWRAPEPSPSNGGCCKICTTSKACGNSCISRNYTCHKGPGCACDG